MLLYLQTSLKWLSELSHSFPCYCYILFQCVYTAKYTHASPHDNLTSFLFHDVTYSTIENVFECLFREIHITPRHVFEYVVPGSYICYVLI